MKRDILSPILLGKTGPWLPNVAPDDLQKRPCTLSVAVFVGAAVAWESPKPGVAVSVPPQRFVAGPYEGVTVPVRG